MLVWAITGATALLLSRGPRLANSVGSAGIAVGCLLGLMSPVQVLLWLVAWEVMSLLLYFLVTLNGDDKQALNAGWTYLVATHLATARLAPAVLLCGGTGPEWTLQPVASVLTPSVAGVVFVFAAIGFGAKAGLMPFHVWMPDTYSRAPSFVPALSSGLMSKVGIHGLERVMLLLGVRAPLWWGLLLLAMGLVSGLGGLLFALPQRDVRRTLAYSSSENIGIIYLGLGIGVIGFACRFSCGGDFGIRRRLVARVEPCPVQVAAVSRNGDRRTIDRDHAD